MKILKKGNSFVAYTTEKGEFDDDPRAMGIYKGLEAGKEIARISIKTSNWQGWCGMLGWEELHERLEKHLEPEKKERRRLFHKVINQLNKDLNNEDWEGIETLFFSVETDILDYYIKERLKDEVEEL